MLQTWFKIFFRNSKKNWLNIIINISGLTLGLAGLLIVLLYLNDEESYNANNPNKNEIYRVVHRMKNGEVWGSSSDKEGPYYTAEIPEVTDYYLSNGFYHDIVTSIDGNQVFVKDVLKGEPNFFDFFPFKILEGSTDKFKEARNYVALSEEQAKLLFKNESAIGKVLKFSDKPFVITTVYKIEGKHYFMPNMIMQYGKEPKGGWGSFSDNLFIKTSEKANVIDLEKKSADIWYKHFVLPTAKKEGITPELLIEKYGMTSHFELLSDIRLKSINKNDGGPEGAGNYQLILIMLSLSVLLILISCVNFINLSIASATQRAKEVGVKKTLGRLKTSLTFQYCLEIVIQGFISLLFALILVELLLPSFNDFMNKDISILNTGILIQIIAISFIVSLLIGIIPAIYFSKFKAVEVLKGNVFRTKQGVLARNLMLGVQFLISGFFFIGSIIINQQVSYMIHKDLGFKGDQIVMIPINKKGNKFKKYQLAQKELIKHSNIEAVTSNSYIIGGGNSSSTNFDHKDFSIQTNIDAIDYNYFDVMGIEILKGRDFELERASDTIKNVIINESLAKAFNIYDDPIGKKISAGMSDDDNDGKDLNIIGMVKDYHVLGLDVKIPPTVYISWSTFSYSKENIWMIQFKIKPNNAQETLNYIEDYWKENIEQGYPFEATFVNKRFANTYKKYEKQQTLFLILTSIVILISLLGLFALATLTIQQRLKEVAIRKTLGASIKEIMFQLMKSFFKITIIASVFLIPIAYYFMQNWLEDFIYRIEMPLIPYIITPIVLVVLVFVVVGLKAYNATKVDLIKYLKFE